MRSLDDCQEMLIFPGDSDSGNTPMSDAYRKSGVDIDAGDAFIDRIRPFVRQTKRNGVLDDIGGFGGCFAPNTADLQEPVLVSSTDGVGTKLLLARELNRFDTIGQDLVAMCVNDIICHGAEPLFFLDYLATGKLNVEKHSEVVASIARACKETHCALLGGETAEMPGCYQGEDFDLAGFAVGMVDRAKLLDGSNIRVGDAVICIASSGFHSNGYSLIRHLVGEAKLDLHKPRPGAKRSLGEELLEPTILYSPAILSLLKEFEIHGIAHITGGGLWENIPRIFPKGIGASLKRSLWEVPPVMRFFQEMGKIDDQEFFRVFNGGIGMVIVVREDDVEELLLRLQGFGKQASWIGSIIRGTKGSPPITIS